MDHAITVKDILIIAGCGLALIGVVGGLLGLVWLFNPFRSGH